MDPEVLGRSSIEGSDPLVFSVPSESLENPEPSRRVAKRVVKAFFYVFSPFRVLVMKRVLSSMLKILRAAGTSNEVALEGRGFQQREGKSWFFHFLE